MTFAEILVFLVVAVLFYRALRPIQRKMESWLLRKLGPLKNKKDPKETVIDITDYTSKKDQ